MPSRLDIIAELLLSALNSPTVDPSCVGFVYVQRGGTRDGFEELVQGPTREEADAEAARIERERKCTLTFMREQSGAASKEPARPKTGARRSKRKGT